MRSLLGGQFLLWIPLPGSRRWRGGHHPELRPAFGWAQYRERSQNLFSVGFGFSGKGLDFRHRHDPSLHGLKNVWGFGDNVLGIGHVLAVSAGEVDSLGRHFHPLVNFLTNGGDILLVSAAKLLEARHNTS